MELQIGDRVRLNERAAELVRQNRRALDKAYLAFDLALDGIKHTRDKMYKDIALCQPELEGLQLVVRYDDETVLIIDRQVED